MTQLTKRVNRRFDTPTWDVDEDTALTAEGFPANQAKFLGRTDDARIYILLEHRRYRRKNRLLGAITEVAAGTYRIIAYGQIPCPADSSVEFTFDGAIAALYVYDVAEGIAAKRLKDGLGAAPMLSDRDLMLIF